MAQKVYNTVNDLPDTKAGKIIEILLENLHILTKGVDRDLMLQQAETVAKQIQEEV